jgi:hypothetical protein
VLSLIRLHRNDLPGARDAVGAAPGELPGTGRATCRPAGPSSGPPPAPAARPASTASSTAEPPASPPPTAPSTPPRCPTATCRSPPRSTQASNDAPASRSGDLQLTEAGIDLAPAAAAARNLRARKKGITVVQPSNQDLGGVVRGRRRRGSYALPPPRQLLKVREPPDLVASRMRASMSRDGT